MPSARIAQSPATNLERLEASAVPPATVTLDEMLWPTTEVVALVALVAVVPEEPEEAEDA